MPRRDRTFSDLDVIRIIGKHLTEQERDNVLEALCEGKEDVSSRIIDAIVEEAAKQTFKFLLSRIPAGRIALIRALLNRQIKKITRKALTAVLLIGRR